MKVLVACEMSGRVREAFRRRGHDAWSCDLLPSLDGSPYHIEGDVYEELYAAAKASHPYDLIIAHPPCTYLTVAGNGTYSKRDDLFLPAAAFARGFMGFADRVCIENPVGRLSTLWRRPDQYIQPYEYGEDASKKTCLWLKGLPLLHADPDKRKPGRIVEDPPGSGIFRERWANQTDSGQNRLGPSENRSLLRSITYEGIAEAMATQWG